MKLTATSAFEFDRLLASLRHLLDETVDANAKAWITFRNAVSDRAATRDAKRHKARLYRETMEALNKLDQADLADLRMSRADFHFLAKRKAGMD
ncbi:hypothetical protein R3X27_12730 [Tropicimonas sp. TH_r6]|uniref:hypothetical protein n=1 Tax=Tropicimonas sp. TH_r6 TaxID=3082085 RepID=UPI0029533D51|nr:hypothetical protein [Tropicimonas sp. TH_r6]MDV7143544.1 hypothetical protein [Tropicimonas sp. TH_r6]